MSNLLPTDYQHFIALSRYARWREHDQRRETWTETVSRYFDFITETIEKKHQKLPEKSLRRLY
jgi:ribonucleoside-triphosphate reductase